MRPGRSQWVASAVLLASLALASGASAADEQADAPRAAAPGPRERRPDTVATDVSAAAVGASVVPGILVHGSGHYVNGDRDTAKKLLWMEVAGLGLIVMALVPAPIVGANPYVVPLSALSAMSGVALFGGSWLFDVYGVATVDADRGVPQTRPRRITSFVGYRYVYDPIFEYRHFVVEGFELGFGRFRVAPRLDLSPNDANARYRTLVSYRLQGATADQPTAFSDGSFVDLNAGVTHHRFPRDGFDVSTAELTITSRLDLRRIQRELRGTFLELGAGVGISRYRYEAAGAGSDDNGLLLMNFGLGAYLGDPTRRGGEARLYYDHRHDDFAAGMKLTGLGSGVLGHFGADLSYFVSPDWGAHVDFQVGSAYVSSFSLLYRPEEAR